MNQHCHALLATSACWQHLIGRLECVIEDALGAGHQDLAGPHDVCQRLDGPCHKWRRNDLQSRATCFGCPPLHCALESVCSEAVGFNFKRLAMNMLSASRCMRSLTLQPCTAGPTTSIISAALTTCAMSPEARSDSGRATPCRPKKGSVHHARNARHTTLTQDLTAQLHSAQQRLASTCNTRTETEFLCYLAPLRRRCSRAVH